MHAFGRWPKFVHRISFLTEASRHHDGRLLLSNVMSIERYVKTDSLFLEHITHAAQIVGWRDAE